MKETEDDRRRRFDTLFAWRTDSDIVAYCRWRTVSPSDAQDAAADVFLTAWRRLDELPAGDAARVWLYATARRVLANQRRAGRRRTALVDRMAQEESGRPGRTSSEEHALVHDALRRLPVRDREVLLLAESETLPTEIATVVGCLTVTARGRLHRARHRFRAVFEDLSDESGHATEHSSVTQRRVRHEHV